MALTISGSVIIQDNNNRQHIINTNDMEFKIIDSLDKEKGVLRIHNGYWEENNWSIKVNVEEYPLGAYNTHELNARNCRVLKDNIKCRWGLKVNTNFS